jgi:protein-S-isoprenylcysteine O-methyltransferase Ste14
MYVAVVICFWDGRSLPFAPVGRRSGGPLAFHVRVVFGEEPWLAKTHGEAWTRYVSEVPRWLGVPHRAPSRDRA